VSQRSVALARRRDVRGTLLIDLELEADGMIRLGRFDTGPAADAARGGDVERDLRVAPDALPALCFELLRQRLDGRLDALDDLRALAGEAGIALAESGWN